MSELNKEALPTTWEKTKISEIATLIRGVSYKKENARYDATEGYLPILRATNITGNSLGFDDAVYVPLSCLKDNQILRYGDIVIASSSGSKEIVGKAGQFFSPTWTGSFGAFCTGIRPETSLDVNYFGYYFQSPIYRKAISDISAGSNINNIKSTDMGEHIIPIAPLAEQTRIAAKLEELLTDLDAGVTELKTAQKKLTQYRQSLLKAAVEGALTAEWRANNTPSESGNQLLERILKERRARWEQKQLEKFNEQGKTPPKDWQSKYSEPVKPDTKGLMELPEGWIWASVEQLASDAPYSLAIGPFGSNLKVSDYQDDGVPLVFVRNIRSGKYGGEKTKFITLEKARELKAHSVQAGDVLITKMGEPPGDADVYPFDQPTAIITADCIKVTCAYKLMHANFLSIVINSNVGKSQIRPMTQGVAQKKVSLGRFSSLAVPIPSYDEQMVIVDHISTVLKEAHSQEVSLIQSLKQSAAQRKNILKAAFSGQLVPQDSNDEPASVLLERIKSERVTQKIPSKFLKGHKTTEAS